MLLKTTSTSVQITTPCTANYELLEGRLLVKCSLGTIRTSNVRNTIRKGSFLVVSTAKSYDTPRSHWIFVDENEWTTIQPTYTSFNWERKNTNIIVKDGIVLLKHLNEEYSLGKILEVEYYDVSNYISISCEQGKITFAL